MLCKCFRFCYPKHSRMTILYAILILATLALLGTALATYLRVKRHLSYASDTVVRKALQEEEEPGS
jgi:hypothetical protein